MLTLSVMMAALMQALDTTIANVALPHIQGSLSASADEINWVLTAYITAAAIATMPTGWLSGKFGSKRVFSFAVAGLPLPQSYVGFPCLSTRSSSFAYYKAFSAPHLFLFPRQPYLTSIHPISTAKQWRFGE
jgi:MFS family permease